MDLLKRTCIHLASQRQGVAAAIPTRPNYLLLTHNERLKVINGTSCRAVER